tara:strand:+ start:5342 stop:5917 length:576 start_codon:yes stop_codon:yes gene_type:complete
VLTSLPRVKSYAAITTEDSDPILETLIGAVTRRIQTHLRRPIEQAKVLAETHDHAGISDRLQLRQWPIASTGLVVRIDDAALVAADFAVESHERGWLIYAPSGSPADWPGGRRHIEVDYTHGYAVADIPDDIVEAATTQVVWQFNRTGHRGSRLGSRSTELAEGATATWMVDAWAPEVLAQLKPYRRLEAY